MKKVKYCKCHVHCDEKHDDESSCLVVHVKCPCCNESIDVVLFPGGEAESMKTLPKIVSPN